MLSSWCPIPSQRMGHLHSLSPLQGDMLHNRQYWAQLHSGKAAGREQDCSAGCVAPLTHCTAHDAEHKLHSLTCHTVLARQWRSQPDETLLCIKKSPSHIFQIIKAFAEITYKNIARAHHAEMSFYQILVTSQHYHSQASPTGLKLILVCLFGHEALSMYTSVVVRGSGVKIERKGKGKKGKSLAVMTSLDKRYGRKERVVTRETLLGCEAADDICVLRVSLTQQRLREVSLRNTCCTLMFTYSRIYCTIKVHVYIYVYIYIHIVSYLNLWSASCILMFNSVLQLFIQTSKILATLWWVRYICCTYNVSTISWFHERQVSKCI